jgi:hypothetical protein
MAKNGDKFESISNSGNLKIISGYILEMASKSTFEALT